nr:Maff2 family [uncultured bacterium]
MCAFRNQSKINQILWRYIMEFFNSAVDVLQTLAIALGAGLGIWGVINLLEGYGNDNPGANAHVR